MDSYVVIDIETTGLSKHRHKITEIAAVKVCNGKIVDEFQTLVNPERPIPRFITKLTGISDDMVCDAETIDSVLPSFFDFVGDCVIIAHNATFDYGFIAHNANKYLNYDFSNNRLCTVKLANRLVPQLSSKALGALCEHFEIINEQSHRALADVYATVKVFDRFLEMMNKLGIKNMDEVCEFEKKPKRRC